MTADEKCAWCGHVEDEFDHVPCREALAAEAKGELDTFLGAPWPGGGIELGKDGKPLMMEAIEAMLPSSLEQEQKWWDEGLLLGPRPVSRPVGDKDPT